MKKYVLASVTFMTILNSLHLSTIAQNLPDIPTGDVVPIPAKIELNWDWDEVYSVNGMFFTQSPNVSPIVKIWPTTNEVDLILVIDSGFYEAEKDPSDYRAQGLVELIDQLAISINIGLVDYASDVRVVQPLTNDHNAVKRDVLNLGVRGTEYEHSNLYLALDRTIEEFEDQGRPESQHVILLYLADPLPFISGYEEYANLIQRLIELGIVVNGVYLGEDTLAGNVLASCIVELTWAGAVSPISLIQATVPENLIQSEYQSFTASMPKGQIIALYIEDGENNWQFKDLRRVDQPGFTNPPLGPALCQFGRIDVECRDDKPIRMMFRTWPQYGNPSELEFTIGRLGECPISSELVIPVQSELNIVQGLVDYPMEKQRQDGSIQEVPPYRLISGKKTLVRVNVGYGSLSGIRQIDQAILNIIYRGAPIQYLEGTKAEKGWYVWGDTEMAQPPGESWRFIVNGDILSNPGEYEFSVSLYESGMKVAEVDRSETFCSVQPEKILFASLGENLLGDENTAVQTLNTINDFFSKFPFPTINVESMSSGPYWDFIQHPLEMKEDCFNGSYCWNFMDFPGKFCSIWEDLSNTLETYNTNPHNTPDFMPAKTIVGLGKNSLFCWPFKGLYGHHQVRGVASINQGILSHELGHYFGNISGPESPAFGGGGAHSINPWTCTYRANNVNSRCEDWGWDPYRDEIFSSPNSMMDNNAPAYAFLERYEYNYSLERYFNPDYQRSMLSTDRKHRSLNRFVTFGFIHMDNSVTISNSFKTTQPIQLTSARESEYKIQFINKEGELLSTWPIQVSFDIIHDADFIDDPTAFRVTSPIPDEAVSIHLTNMNTVMWSKTRSLSPPSVKMIYPIGNESFSTNESVTVQWIGEDPDGDQLIYDLYYSQDGGVSLKLVAAVLRVEQFEVNTSSFPMTDNGLFKVVASDGYYLGGCITPNPFSIANKPPVVSIVKPPDGATIHIRNSLDVQSHVIDLEDGHNSKEVRWFVDDKVLLSSPIEPIVTLPMPRPGLHNIRLEAIDSDGNIGSDVVSVFIIGDMKPGADAGLYYMDCCESSFGANITLNGSKSWDPGGRLMSYHWEVKGVKLDNPNSISPTGLFPPGLTKVSLKVIVDGEASAISNATVFVHQKIPRLVLEKSTIDFGEVTIDQLSRQIFRIRNVGEATLQFSISRITDSKVDENQFRLTLGDFLVPAGKDTLFEISFIPMTEKENDLKLIVHNSNDKFWEDKIIHLRGKGVTKINKRKIPERK